MRSKTTSRGHKTRHGKKLNTAKRRSRSMKLGGVQISAQLQKPARPARRAGRKHSPVKPVVEQLPLAVGSAAAESQPVVETQPIVQQAAFHAAAKPSRTGHRMTVWGMAICVIAITGALLFVGRPVYAPPANPPFEPAKIPAAPPESNRGMDKAAPKILRAEATPAAPAPPPADVSLPFQPATVLATLEEPRVAEASLGPIEQPSLVTITGCLDSDRDTFTLKDTTGVDAPSSRSWRTGFLKKRRASIGIVNPVSGLGLQNHVGQRVSLTGSLVDRDMQVRSLRRLAASCKG